VNYRTRVAIAKMKRSLFVLADRNSGV